MWTQLRVFTYVYGLNGLCLVYIVYGAKLVYPALLIIRYSLRYAMYRYMYGTTEPTTTLKLVISDYENRNESM